MISDWHRPIMSKAKQIVELSGKEKYVTEKDSNLKI